MTGSERLGFKSFFALILVAALSAPASAQTQPYQAQAREIYSRIIGFRTAEGHGQTAAMAVYLTDVLRAGGVPQSDIVTLNDGEATALLVRVAGNRSPSQPILFSAHMDVVDARPQEWTRDPFTLVEENGFFLGRGTADNKAGVVALLNTILRFKAQRLRPAHGLVFAFVGDEETDMRTTRRIVAHPWVKDAQFAINTDSGGGLLDARGKALLYRVQRAEKTYVTFELIVTNPGGHSSKPRADNAIYQLARALLKIEAHRFPPMANELTREYFAAIGNAEGGPLGEALRKFAANPDDTAAAERLSADPEFVGTVRTTCVGTMLEAGHAENALPQTAKATVNCRVFPGTEVEEVRAALAAAIGDAKVSIQLRGTATPSPITELRPDVMAAIERAVHARHPGVPVISFMGSGGTDGKIYRRAGIPTFATSGMFTNPDETYAHGLDERLPTAAFYEGLDHIYMLATEFSRASSQ